MINRVAYARALLGLNRLRLRRLLGGQPAAEGERLSRSRLLPWLAANLARPEQFTLDTLDADLVEGAVATASAQIDEDADTKLTPLCLAAQMLASDSQFGRLLQMSEPFEDLARLNTLSRPYLATSLYALSRLLRQQWDNARVELERAFGGVGDSRIPTTRVPRTSESLGDVLVATSFLRWLRTGDQTPLRDALNVARENQLGHAFELVQLLLTYANAAAQAELKDTVSAAEPIFRDSRLVRYLELRGIRTLFPAQLRAISAGVLGDGSYLVALPTSSGKTLLAELRIAAEFMRRPDSRVIYLAPYRLLTRQVVRELSRNLARLQRRVTDVGAEFDLSVSALMGEGASMPDVGVMTPERLDSLMRLANSDRPGSAEAARFLEDVRLLVFDEIHLLGRPGRGPRLELLLSRFRLRYPTVSVVGLSGVIGGTAELAAWLGPNDPIFGGRRPTGSIEMMWSTSGDVFQKIGERRVKVKSLERSSSAIGDAARLALSLAREARPILIVENNRPNAEGIARKLSELDPEVSEAWRAALTEPDLRRVAAVADDVQRTMGMSSELARLIKNGIAYHHAGVPTNLLRGIEDLTNRKLLRFLCATTTVAEGAHLPFRLVLIPHLNFESASRRLEKDLYLNILGRAGRASLAMEGVVILLGSDSPTLRSHVAFELWNDRRPVAVAGRLAEYGAAPVRPSDFDTQWDIESQLLAWLGDGDSFRENQSLAVAEATFSWSSGSQTMRGTIERAIQSAFEKLEGEGLVEAGSPYRLTPLGRRARLSGMSPETCLRVAEALSRTGMPEFFLGLYESASLSEEQARIIATLLLETIEVLRNGLWFRRAARTDADKVAVAKALLNRTISWPYDDDLFRIDVEMLAGWVLGGSYAELSDTPPVFGGRGLFGPSEEAARTADAAEYFGHLTYPAAWAWSTVIAMAGEMAQDVPGWTRQAVQYGVPTQSAARLIAETGISRTGALSLTASAGAWPEVSGRIRELGPEELEALSISATDRQLLLNWGDAL